jgi:hypothetical protein
MSHPRPVTKNEARARNDAAQTIEPGRQQRKAFVVAERIPVDSTLREFFSRRRRLFTVERVLRLLKGDEREFVSELREFPQVS